MVETLMLSRGHVPMEIVDYKRALSLCYVLETAIPLKEYPDKVLHTPTTTFLIPSVIQLIDSDYTPKRYVKCLPFNRKNVYMRDHGRCMYCGKKVGIASFTFDHVYPRVLGGLTEWTNIVVSCMRCNTRKGSRPLAKCGMTLIRKPYEPRLDKAAPASLVNKIGMEIPHESWEDYVYWSIELLP